MAKRVRSSNPGDVANAFIRVLLSDAGELAGGLDDKEWDETLKFFCYRCAYTGEPVTKDSVVKEHAIPINKDHCGLHLYGNVVPATSSANSKKGSKHYGDYLKDIDKLKKIEDFMEKAEYHKRAELFQHLPAYCQPQYEVIKALCKSNRDYLRTLVEGLTEKDHDDVTKSKDVQVQVRLGRRGITREAVLAVIRGAGRMGLRRGEIIEALGVRGNKSGQIAVDNRLRELKQRDSVLHGGGRYRHP